MVGRPSRRSALPGRLRFIVKRAIRTLGAFAASMLCLSAVVNASFEATVRSQIDEAAMGAVMASGSSSPEAILALRAEIRAGLERSYGLDAPSWLRVVRQTGRILRLDLGEARFDRTAYPEHSREVRRIVMERHPPGGAEPWKRAAASLNMQVIQTAGMHGGLFISSGAWPAVP